MDFAGYLFDEEMALYQRSYYNQRSEKFEVKGLPTRIMPGPITFEAPVAVLVGPACASACEGFAYALSQGGRALILGHYPTAGLFGEVGRGQYELPGDISMQFPTGRPETLGGDLLLEGVGVVPDVIIPVTEGSAQGRQDTVLDAAVEALLEQINR
jgi:C-terminal processing protease CtpA/Prc